MFETELRRKDGSLFPVVSTSMYVTFMGQEYNFAFAVDVTERKQLEEEGKHLASQLLHAQKLESLGRLAGGVAHSFNNALTVIYGRCGILLDQFAATDPRRHDVAQMLRVAEGAAHLTRELLVFSRRQPLRVATLDPSRVIQDATKIARAIIGEHIEVRTDLAQQIGSVEFDRTQMDQVLINLLLNARDAMPGEGVVDVSTSMVQLDEQMASLHDGLHTGAHVEIKVHDTGEGIDPADLPHVFEPFFTTKDVGQGVGLGLATVHGAVKSSGGLISVASTVGKGTTVSILLPAVSTAVNVPPALVETTQPPVETTRRTVLVAEDEDNVRAVAEEILRTRGYRVLSARDGRQALELAATEPAIDLLLTDVVMPGMTGPDLASKLTQTRANMKVVFMTGYSFLPGRPQEPIELEHLTLRKPFTPKVLLDAIGQALGA